jgi:uncharacterized membrane protein
MSSIQARRIAEKRDKILALSYHVTEFLGLLGLIGLIWSYRKLGKTYVETDRDKANG